MRDLAGSRALVLGLGVTGRAVAAVLAEAGANVLASDEAEPTGVGLDELRSVGVSIETGSHERAEAELAASDLVVPSPGISPHRGFLREVVERGVRILSELDLAAGLTSSPILAVTGTNGKTTVCRLAGSIARATGLRVVSCGNLETPFVAAVAESRDADLFVVEASSFGLYFCESFRPRVSVVTNLSPDHLDWHDSFEDYRRAKSRIAARQGPGDLYLFPREQPELEDLAPTGPDRVAFAAPDGEELVVGCRGREVRARGVAALGRRGAHFAADAAAAAAAMVFFGAGAEAIEQAFGSFEFAAHRLEPVGVLDGVKVVDDSVSTNPAATIAALRAVAGDEAGRIVLIAGGRNKGLDLAPIAGHAGRLRAAVLIGEAASELEGILAPAGVATKTVGSMPEAVGVAMDLSKPGDVVLLSPACASHDMFGGYADRGRAFREACRALGVRG